MATLSRDLGPEVVHWDAPERLRMTPEETGAHQDDARCKARGGSALIGGQRSPGRWNPACTCGWVIPSNDDRRAAEADWRQHRRGAVAEARRLAAGEPVWHVSVGFKGEDRVRSVRVCFSEERARQAAARVGGGMVATIRRTTDGETWTEVA